MNGTARPISARRGRRLLGLGIITVVFVTALAAPSISAPRSAAGSDIAGDQAGRSNRWIARPPLRHARGGLGVARSAGRSSPSAGSTATTSSMSSKPAELRASGGGVTWRPADGPGQPGHRRAGGPVYAIGGIETVGMMNSLTRTSWRRTTRGRVVGRRAFPFPNHATGPERRVWTGCCTWPGVHLP